MIKILKLKILKLKNTKVKILPETVHDHIEAKMIKNTKKFGSILNYTK